MRGQVSPGSNDDGALADTMHHWRVASTSKGRNAETGWNRGGGRGDEARCAAGARTRTRVLGVWRLSAGLWSGARTGVLPEGAPAPGRPVTGRGLAGTVERVRPRCCPVSPWDIYTATA